MSEIKKLVLNRTIRVQKQIFNLFYARLRSGNKDKSTN